MNGERSSAEPEDDLVDLDEEPQVEEEPPAPGPRLLWSVLVAALVLAAYPLTILWWRDSGVEVQILSDLGFTFGSYVTQSLVYAPLMLAVLLLGRTPVRKGAAAAIVVLAVVLTVATRNFFLEHLLFAEPQDRVMSWTTWAAFTAALFAVLAVLAWGVARRRGRLWPIGALIGATAAVVLAYLHVRMSGDQSTTALLGTALVLVSPVLAGCLFSWLVESAEFAEPAS